MARATGFITPTERLSDKVYARLREEIETGAIEPGRRFVETEIAARLGVSRTPVREALIRLAREGVLEPADRGFALIREDRAAIMERLDARRLLDVAIARRAARAAVEKGADVAAFDALLRRETSAHAAGRARAFAAAHYELRDAIRTLAGNRVIARCAAMVDDSFQLGREKIYREAENRALTLEADGRLVQTIVAGDADAAETETLAFIARIEARLGAAA